MAKKVLSKDQFKELASRLESYDEQLRPDYSGRGMYGKSCLGYSGEKSEAEIQFELAAVLADNEIGNEAYREDPDGIVDVLRSMMNDVGAPSRDGMGLGVIYYWRGIQVEGYENEGRF